VLLTLYCAGDKIEKNEMGGSCSSVGGRCVYRFWWENLRLRDHWGEAGIYGMIILRWMYRKFYVGVWTGLG
jgi:hypothetical protein